MVSSRWFSEDAAALPDCISNLYSFQPLPVTETDVLETDGKINVNTAPVETLLAVLGTRTPGLATPLSESDVEDLVRYREENEFKTVEDVNRVIKISTTQAGAIAGLIKVNSSFFTVRSKFTTGKIARQVEAMLKRDGNTVATMSWREY